VAKFKITKNDIEITHLTIMPSISVGESSSLVPYIEFL